MGIAEDEIRRVNEEMRERPAARRDRAGERALPVRWKWLAVQGAEEIEVDGIARVGVDDEEVRVAAARAAAGPSIPTLSKLSSSIPNRCISA